jgi:hypothetical protein
MTVGALGCMNRKGVEVFPLGDVLTQVTDGWWRWWCGEILIVLQHLREFGAGGLQGFRIGTEKLAGRTSLSLAPQRQTLCSLLTAHRLLHH